MLPLAETARRSLENELQVLKSSGSASSSEIETLRARITSLETSNRETLAIVDSKTQANANLADELQKQHQKILKLNQDVTSLNQSVQTAQTAANSAKYREESLKQELELARKNNDWYENELKTKNAEALKFRKEKGARIAELQRLNEDANSSIESLTRNEQLLRKRLGEAQSKAEEALTKVQQLQEAAARAEESFKQELESSRRLVELKDQQSQTHRNRLKEVELRLEQVKDDGADEIRRVRQELEQEKQERIDTEQRLHEVQIEVDSLKSQLETQESSIAAPQTPRANGSYMGRPSFGTPGSLRKSQFRSSDALEELGNVKVLLLTEKRLHQSLQEKYENLQAFVDANQPRLEDLEADNNFLKDQLVNMSELAENAHNEREEAFKDRRKAEAAAATAQAEVKILRTQLRDLSTQIHVLIFNIHAQEKGLDQLTEEETEQFERIQRGEISEDALADLSDTHQFITQKFVTFKEIYELQEKNQELLRVTRELADRMEEEEAQAAQRQAETDHQETEDLRTTVLTLEDEVKSLTVRMKSYVTERDMFRRMLQQKASSAEIHAALGTSADQRSVLATIEQSSGDEAELAVAFRELQSQFDSYRNDQSIDSNAMKEQITKLSTEKAALQSEISRVSSQLTLATERYNMLDSNFKATQSEMQELQKRNQVLSEAAAKQDMRTQQVAEDLVEAKGLAESLRSENANLKAEKSLWKSIQDRLNQDNEGLTQEKARLNTLLSTQQSLLNERELSESETRRRLQNQVDSLESELSTTKRKLSEEVEEGKKIQLRKEFDNQQYQKRIDDLTATIGQIKEESVAIKTTRDHLQARVGELEIEVKNAQERADRLRPIPTARSQAAGPDPEAESQARISELENEVADLKNALELANMHLENAKQQTEQFKQLSRDLEDELSSINESQEQYRQQMDAALDDKTSTITELQQRAEGLSAELSNSNNELNLLRDSQADISRKFEEKERMLSGEIARLKEEEERFKETAKFHQQDLRAQAEIATRAQQDYEEELVKHAEAAKHLQQIRAEHNELKTQAASWKAEAESARLSLAQSEQSWEERRQQLEQEMEEIKTRREDTNAQNKLLHQQLESVTSQISSLQHNRSQFDDGADAGSATDTASEGLRELNNYLRREKEILEVQYDLKVQEAKRLQQQYEYSQTQLDEARLKLEQERRSQADSARNSLTHKELMDKLNELNLIRESNTTLRNENQRTRAQLEQKSVKIEELESKIQPLEARISEMELDKSFREAEIKQLQEARDALQKRIESILSKYGQADPHEVEQLKTTVTELESERNAHKESAQSLQEKADGLEKALEEERANWKSTKERLAEDFKTRFRSVKSQRDDANVKMNSLQESLNGVNARLAEVERELEVTTQNLKLSEDRQAALQEQLLSSNQQQANPEAAPAPTQETAVADPEVQQQLENLRQMLEDVSAQKAAVDAELEQLRIDLQTAISDRDDARIEAAQNASAAADTEMQESADMSNAAPATAPTPGSSSLSDEERAALEAKVVEAEARAAEFEAKAKELEEHADSIIKQRSEKMKTALNKKLAEAKEELAKQVQAEKDAVIQQQNGETERQKEELQKEFNLKLQQELAIIKAEHQTSGPPNGVQGVPPSTPAKPSNGQGPQTPTVGTPGLIDLSKLGDAETRDLLMKNATVMNVIKTNVKNKVAMETKKAREEVEAAIKTEYEQKINTAREQAAALTEKKSALRINMLDRQFKTAQAKFSVVEVAAKETPQRPVVEVWNIAKDAKPVIPAPAPVSAQAAPAAIQTTPAPAPAPAPAPSVPATATGKLETRPGDVPTAANREPDKSVSTPTPTSATEETKPQPSSIPAPQPGTAQPTAAPTANPFGQSITTPAAGNPFAGTPAAGQQPPPPQQQHQQQQQQGQGSGPPQPAPRSSIPRGGAGGGRGRGTYQAGPGRGGQGQRGRGGFGRGGAQGLNPGAGDFNPGGAATGAKRPREDGGGNPGAGGAKRPRGGGNAGGGGGGQAN